MMERDFPVGGIEFHDAVFLDGGEENFSARGFEHAVGLGGLADGSDFGFEVLLGELAVAKGGGVDGVEGVAGEGVKIEEILVGIEGDAVGVNGGRLAGLRLDGFDAVHDDLRYPRRAWRGFA